MILVAHLEGFVEDLVGDVIDEFHRRLPASSDLPKVLLAEHVIGELTTITAMTDREKRAVRIARLFETRAPLWLSATLAAGSLSAQTISATLSNPGAKEIARVLGLLGMSDVFERIELPDGADPVRRMDEIVGVRNAIAHGDDPTLADDDVVKYMSSVEAVGEGLDDAAARHVCSICHGPAPW